MPGDTNTVKKSQRDYQVFLSFRGCDTRQGFTDSLYHFLIDAGVRVFRDNEELRPGHKIEEVLMAINKSIVCIPILSKNYANSKWCLLELAEMVKLKKDIMPIFYKVEADDVKLKTNLYSDHLSNFGKQYDAEKVKWEKALKKVGSIFDTAQLEGSFKEVGRIKAWTIMDYPGYGELCKEVVSEVLNKLEVKHKVLEGPLVGIDDHVEAIKKLLDIVSSDVRFIVIHGVGGVGKTTLAKVIFNQLFGGFHCCCFLGNVRETTNRHGIKHLQNKLLKELSPRAKEIGDVDSGIKTIKDIVKNKKVLIVLDDLDQQKQMENLARDPTWFDSGSRIIITTRDLNCVVKHSELWDYNMSEMSSDHALQLFCKHAFKMDSPPIDCLHISKKVVAACGRLPLAVEVMGSYLHHIDKDNWKSKIKTIASNSNVQKKLMISFMTLDPRAKEIFLDIACFFIDYERKYAVYMWEACDFRPNEGIEQLLSMSLIKISDDNTFWMHDLLRDLGREIVAQENLKRPERRSRLWSSEELVRVLSREKGTSHIDALSFIPPLEDEDRFGTSSSPVTANHIRPLQNLRFLELCWVKMEGDFRGALRDLKWLSWHSLRDLSVTNLELEDLVILDFSISRISPHLLRTIKIGRKLKVLNLSGCFSENEDELEFPETLGNLSSLVELDISSECVKKVPYFIGNLNNLMVMRMSFSLISELPGSIGNLEKLEELDASDSALKDIPEDIGRLHQLRIIDMSRSKICRLPATIDQLPRIQHLRLEGCDQIQELPNLPLSLTILRVSSKSLRRLPNLSNLERLNDLLWVGSMHLRRFFLGHHLSAKAGWINSCPSLESFELAFKNITYVYMETSAFPHLKRLRLRCPDIRVIGQLPLSLTTLYLSDITMEMRLPACLREMEALNCLELSQCRFIGELPLPRNLKTLRINRCCFSQPFIDLSGLTMLRSLAITNCEMLTAVQGVEAMKFLEEITVLGCPSLKEISDLSKFERLVVTTTDDHRGLFRGINEVIAKDPVQAADDDDLPDELDDEQMGEFTKMFLE